MHNVHMHTYIHTYIHTHIHTHIHTYIHTYLLTYIHTYIHTYIYMYIEELWEILLATIPATTLNHEPEPQSSKTAPPSMHLGGVRHAAPRFARLPRRAEPVLGKYKANMIRRSFWSVFIMVYRCKILYLPSSGRSHLSKQHLSIWGWGYFGFVPICIVSAQALRPIV